MNWKEEDNHKRLKDMLLKRNKEHFRQAKGASFTSEEMLDAIPFTADSIVAKDVLEGKKFKAEPWMRNKN